MEAAAGGLPPGNEADWLYSILDEVGLTQFHNKLVHDLQITSQSHFDYVSEEDLVGMGLSRPAARRLLAAVKKRKSSIVSVIKNKIVTKLINPHPPSPTPPSSHVESSSSKTTNHEPLFRAPIGAGGIESPHGRLTCLINSQDVKVKEEIGHGVHGFVKKGEWTTPNGRVVEVALKILKKDVLAEPGASFNEFIKEISVMHQLNHPNIIKLYGIVLSSPMMMVTELAPFGNLRDLLRREKGCTPVSQLINFSVQVAAGMKYLESRRWVHRDLATRNLFLSHGKKVLIGDLGLMRAIPNDESHYFMTERTKIPYPWCAPESLNAKQFSSASDAYMFGVTMWELFSFGKEPWAGLNMNEILERISKPDQRLPCPEACPTMVYQTLLQCWNLKPESRPNFSTLYQYLSTSYPLEVQSTEHISELNQKRLNSLMGSESSSECQIDNVVASSGPPRKMLTCYVDDRIQVIDGQPEKHWWKGQNQRTFEIGWFPLSSTRWLAPKRGASNRNFKLYFNKMEAGRRAKQLADQTDLSGFAALKIGNSNCIASKAALPKSKTKSRLSKLFGVNSAYHNSELQAFANLSVPHAYQKFDDTHEALQSGSNHVPTRSQLIRSQSDELSRRERDDGGPPLIDFDDEGASTTLPNKDATQTSRDEQSLSDFDIFSPLRELDKASSETRLNEGGNYRFSWNGSWNTGTFDDGSHRDGNMYSSYYCPQDGVQSVADNSKPPDRYYSTVAQD